MKKALFAAWAVIVLFAIYPPSIFIANTTKGCIDTNGVVTAEAEDPDEVEINYNKDNEIEDSIIRYHKRLLENRLDTAQANIATAKKANSKAKQTTQYIKENYYLKCCK